MSVLTVKGARLFTGGYDLSGQIRATALQYGAEPLDATTINSTTRTRVGGLKTVALSHEGFMDPDSSGIDETIFSRIGDANVPVSIAPQSSAGARAFLLQAQHTAYTPRSAVGELFNYNVTIEADASEGLVRGNVLEISTSFGSTGNNGSASTPQNLGTSTGKVVYAALHVLGVEGSTAGVTVVIQSDASSSFSSPTARITFTNAASATGEWKEFTAGTTDSWWRASNNASSSARASVAVIMGMSTHF